MIRALIIDDEESAVNVVRLLLQKYVPEVTQIYTAIGSASGIQAIRQYKPSLVFLDIEMPLMNGFEVIEQFPDHPFEIIFITAYDHYAIKAIKYSALDYLLKPIDAEEMKLAVKRFVEKQATQQSRKDQYKVLLHNLRSDEVSDYRLVLSTTEGTFFFFPVDIIRCEAAGNYTKFFLKSRKPIITSRTLKEYEDILPENIFLRVHRSHLVNKKYVSSIGDEHELKMVDNSIIEVSRRRWEVVKEQLMI